MPWHRYQAHPALPAGCPSWAGTRRGWPAAHWRPRFPAGDKGPGGRPPGRRVGERTNQAWAGQSVGFYYAVVATLLQTGFTPAEIGQLGGGNFFRVFGAATAG